jgi:hypothetical protein
MLIFGQKSENRRKRYHNIDPSKIELYIHTYVVNELYLEFFMKN